MKQSLAVTRYDTPAIHLMIFIIYMIVTMVCFVTDERGGMVLFSILALLYAPYAQGNWNFKKPRIELGACVIHVLLIMTLEYFWISTL